MEKEKAIEYLNDVRNGIHIPAPGIELPLLNEQEKKAVDIAISALEKQEQDRWHSVVKEGNPKESGAYNCTCSDGTPVRRVTAIKYIKGTNKWAMTGRQTFWKVIAWRPLPEPYTEEEV